MLDWLRSKLSGEMRIPGYEIEDHIFSGGFSEIYRAYQTKNRIPVALKILLKGALRIPGFYECLDLLKGRLLFFFFRGLRDGGTSEEEWEIDDQHEKAGGPSHIRQRC